MYFVHKYLILYNQFERTYTEDVVMTPLHIKFFHNNRPGSYCRGTPRFRAYLKKHSCNMVFAVSQEGQFLFSFSVTYCVTSPSTIRINVLSSINVRFQGLMITPLISSSDSAASSTFPMSVIKVDITLPPRLALRR